MSELRITPAALPGVLVVEMQARTDARGFLVRTYCEDTFRDHGLNVAWPQCSQTLTRDRGMLRGLHFQAPPVPEIKLVRCTAGAVFDVVVDIRRDSPTYGRHEAFELSADRLRALYIPAGFAHGFQCLTGMCELSYMISARYDPRLARGVRWNDPALNIAWPIASPQLSERDRELPLLSSLDRTEIDR